VSWVSARREQRHQTTGWRFAARWSVGAGTVAAARPQEFLTRIGPKRELGRGRCERASGEVKRGKKTPAKEMLRGEEQGNGGKRRPSGIGCVSSRRKETGARRARRARARQGGAAYWRLHDNRGDGGAPRGSGKGKRACQEGRHRADLPSPHCKPQDSKRSPPVPLPVPPPDSIHRQRREDLDVNLNLNSIQVSLAFWHLSQVKPEALYDTVSFCQSRVPPLLSNTSSL
jgi:hypothetical protein